MISTINEYFDCVYVLNLDRRPDRLQNMKSKLDKLEIKFVKFSAIDGNEIDLKSNRLFVSSNKKENWKYEVACLISHLEIVNHAKSQNYNRILILEDDCLISNDFLERFKLIQELPEDWKMLYLGASQYDWNLEWFSENFYYSKWTLGAFSYALSSSVFDDVIEELTNFKTTTDNTLTFVQLKYPKDCYTFFPNLMIADVSNSDIREVNEDFNKRIEKMKWDISNYF